MLTLVSLPAIFAGSYNVFPRSLSCLIGVSLALPRLLLRAFFFSVASGTPPPPETCEHVRFDTGVTSSLWSDVTGTIPQPTAG